MPVKEPITEEEWLECIPLPEYLARIPLGHNILITGEEIWVDGNGKDFYSAEDYMAEHGCDPRVVWSAKKAYLKQHGKGVHYA